MKHQAKKRGFERTVASFGKLYLISDHHIKFQKSRNELYIHKGPQNVNYTVVKSASFRSVYFILNIWSYYLVELIMLI